jgi:hypothetical protein
MIPSSDCAQLLRAKSSITNEGHIDYAQFHSRSNDTVVRVYDEAGNVIETQEQAGEFRGF